MLLFFDEFLLLSGYLVERLLLLFAVHFQLILLILDDRVELTLLLLMLVYYVLAFLLRLL